MKILEAHEMQLFRGISHGNVQDFKGIIIIGLEYEWKRYVPCSAYTTGIGILVCLSLPLCMVAWKMNNNFMEPFIELTKLKLNPKNLLICYAVYGGELISHKLLSEYSLYIMHAHATSFFFFSSLLFSSMFNSNKTFTLPTFQRFESAQF